MNKFGASRWLLGVSILTAPLIACRGGDQATTAATTVATTRSITTATTRPPATVPVSTSSTLAPRAECVVEVVSGDSLGAISTRLDSVSLAELQTENGFGTNAVIHPGDEIDVCIDNDIDDVNGTSRLAPEPEHVKAQQHELNELFEGYSIAQLKVDGDSGKLTRQMICIARMGLGQRVHSGHLPAGSEEEHLIFEATELAIPAGAPTGNNRWALIDKTCQVLITGEADDRIVDIFPTSTGEDGYQTFDVQAQAFRFDPAIDNDGWHDSSSFPVTVDNPQNGNMYKPIYFNNGQAIHGAGYVPPFPRSKGCARTFPWHHDRILDWLGISDMTEATWKPSAIGLAVVVQGQYQQDVDEE